MPVFVEIDNSDELREQIATLEAELETDRAEYAKGERYIARIRSEVAVPDETPVAEAVLAEPPKTPAFESTTDLAGQLVAVGLPANPPKELPEILTEAAAIRQELAELQRPFSELNAREGRIPAIPWKPLAGVAVASLAAAGVAWWQDVPLQWPVAGVALCFAGMATFGVLRQRARGKLLEECRKDRQRLDQKKAAAQSKQALLSERCEAMGLPSSAIDLVRLQKLVAAHRSLLDACWSQTSGDAPAGPAEQHAASTVVPPVAASASETSQAQDELRQLEVRLSDFAGKMREKEVRLASLRQQSEAPSQQAPFGAAGGKAVLVRRKLELEERIAVLRKAVDLLANAVESFSGSHLVRLNEEVSRLFGKLTGGRHPEVRLDDNMAPIVLVDGRRWQPIEHFSRGTVDALYLALRIALAKVRGDGRSLPLVLDDPFVHFDQRRMATALNLVDLAATDGQLILLSHNPELGKRAARERWHVITTDGDPVRPATEEGGDHAGQLHLL